MRTVFVLTSPLQVTHALHYRRAAGLGADDCILLHVRSVNARSNDQADEAIAAAPWAAVHALSSYPPRSGEEDGLSPRRREGQARAAFVADLDRLLAGVEVERVVLGDYRPLSFRQVLRFASPGAEVVLLDDGAGTRGVMRYRENPSGAGVILGEMIRSRPLRAFAGEESDDDPFLYLDPRRLTFFSIYDGRLAQEDRLIPNRFYDEVFRTAPPRLVDETWFIGTIHVEMGMAPLKQYLRLVRQIAAGTGPGFVYIPHRREDPGKLALLRDDLALPFRDLGQPIEAHMVAAGAAPRTILSVGSMVVDTASRMLAGHGRVIVVLPPRDYFSGPKTAHLRGTIRDCVLANDGVLSVPADERQLKARLRLAPVTGTAARIAASAATTTLAAGKPSGLVTTDADGETICRETDADGLHRLSTPTVRGGFRLAEAILPLGREHMRLRLALGDAESDVDCDLENPVPPRRLGGKAAPAMIAAAPDADGRIQVRVIGRAPRFSSAQLRLHSLSGPAGRSSNHRGDAALGFALAKTPADVAARVLDLDAASILQLQVDLADPLFAVFPLALDGQPRELMIADPALAADKDLASLATAAGTLMVAHRPAANARWPLTMPLQVAVEGSRTVLRSEGGAWMPLGAAARHLTIALSDGLGGASRITGFDRGPRSDADRLWMRTLSALAEPRKAGAGDAGQK